MACFDLRRMCPSFITQFKACHWSTQHCRGHLDGQKYPERRPGYSQHLFGFYRRLNSQVNKNALGIYVNNNNNKKEYCSMQKKTFHTCTALRVTTALTQIP